MNLFELAKYISMCKSNILNIFYWKKYNKIKKLLKLNKSIGSNWCNRCKSYSIYTSESGIATHIYVKGFWTRIINDIITDIFCSCTKKVNNTYYFKVGDKFTKDEDGNLYLI